MKAPDALPLLTPTDRYRFWEKIKPTLDGCWIWDRETDRKGYPIYNLPWMHRGKCRVYKAHRLAYLLHYGGTDLGTQHVLHTCDTPSCINPAHLFLGSNTDNIKDAIKKGRRPTKLTQEAVEDIRTSHKTSKALADQYGVCASHISRVRKGERWLQDWHDTP